MNHEVMSARATIKEFEEKHGFASDFIEGQSQPDALRLRQSILDKEARTGEPSAQRLLAERAVEAIRASNSLEELREIAGKANCTIVIEDSITKNGKIKYTGFIKASDGSGLKVSLYTLPKDCSAYAIMRRFEAKEVKAPKGMTANQAKYAARNIFKAVASTAPASFEAHIADVEKRLAEKGMSIEKQGKSGAYLRFAEGEEGRIKLSALGSNYSIFSIQKIYKGQGSNNNNTMHDSQIKVNALSRKDASQSASAYADRASSRASFSPDLAVGAGGSVGGDFYGLDFIEQLQVMRGIADAQTAAHASVMRANAAAAEAQSRAKILEEKLLLASQRTTEPSKTEDTQMFDFLKKKQKTPLSNFERDMLASRDTSQVPTWVGKEKEKMTSAERMGWQIGLPAPEWAKKSATMPDSMSDFEKAQQVDYNTRFNAVAEKLEANGVKGLELECRLFAAGQSIFEEHIAAEKAQNASTNIDVSQNEKQTPAVGTPKTETAPQEGKPLTLADRVSEARAKGVFSGGGKPMPAGYSKPLGSSSVNQAPKM